MATFTKASDLARSMRDRASRERRAMEADSRAAAAVLLEEATALTSGSGAPGSLPVPVRTGRLRAGWRIVRRRSSSGEIAFALVNDAAHAPLVLGSRSRRRRGGRGSAAAGFGPELLRRASPRVRQAVAARWRRRHRSAT